MAAALTWTVVVTLVYSGGYSQKAHIADRICHTEACVEDVHKSAIADPHTVRYQVWKPGNGHAPVLNGFTMTIWPPDVDEQYQ